MHDLKALKSQSQDWYDEHAEWAEETLRWQRETKRLVAILYQLERALPEHTLTLTRHVNMIREHQELLGQYENGLDEECYPQCPGFNSEEELEKLHQRLCEMHDKTDLNHRRLRKNYMLEMKSFRALALKLMGKTS
tara:strand:- start:922 stop:1329 length:408 start_codon:yes stop_codon:yes gene_type:complete